MIKAHLAVMAGIIFFSGCGLKGSTPLVQPSVEGVSSDVVSQPHLSAQLISEVASITPGKAFDVIVHLKMDPLWHTYWINPGDAGLATRIDWVLPPGFRASSIQWPTPEVHSAATEVFFGYEGDVYLITTIIPPMEVLSARRDLSLQAKVKWLVCENSCIPGKADLTLNLKGASPGLYPESAQAMKSFFDEARGRLPQDAQQNNWEVTGHYEGKFLSLAFQTKDPVNETKEVFRFLPEQPNVVDTKTEPMPLTKSLQLKLPLQANGEKPESISGILVHYDPISQQPARSTYFARILLGENKSPGFARGVDDVPVSPNLTFFTALLFAFLGGILLNLMPCVLPVLSLKVFSLIRHAGGKPGTAWKQGLAFTGGVVLSFWGLAGVLLFLRRTGELVGWGFQMQNPGFVLFLTILFFVLGLNLLGVFEFGTSLVGLDAKISSQKEGWLSSFFQGALATVAATPCTGPFMGSSLGFAAQQSPALAFLIFTALALGMAFPYILLTTFPGGMRFVPKPGAWMEALKQFMGFCLLATVIFLAYIFAALTNPIIETYLLVLLLFVSIVAWIYGRWSSPAHSEILQRWAIFFVLIGGLGLYFGCTGLLAYARSLPQVAIPITEGWKPYSAEALDQALKQGNPVFVDFTAVWCLSCKANENLVLETVPVQQAFKDHHVVLLRGDWSRNDPLITEVLRHFHRDGVPLYLYYRQNTPDLPVVLPEVLTQNLILQLFK